MPNLQTLFVIKAEDGTLVQADTSYDLSTVVGGIEVPKEVGSAYIIINGDGTVSEYTYPKGGSKYVTKVTNQATGEIAYLDEKPGEVSDLLTNENCGACDDIRPSNPVVIDSSCTAPVFVKICDPVGQDRELIFTDSEPVCVDNAGDLTTWLVRERIVWDSVTYQEISRVTEYSADGLSWSTTAPTGTITVGSCEAPVLSCELIITTPVPLCVRFTNPNASTDPCCGVVAYLYQSWLTREVINWDSSACIEISRVVEYSSDGVTWTTTAPANATLGECPKEQSSCCTNMGCCPKICEANGDDLSTLCASHNFSFTKPECCKVLVETSIGNFTIPANIQSYVTSDFKCTFTVNNVSVVSGTCSLSDVHIIGNKLN